MSLPNPTSNKPPNQTNRVPILFITGYCNLNVSPFRDVITREPPQQLSEPCFIQGGDDNPCHVGLLVLHHCGSVQTAYCDIWIIHNRPQGMSFESKCFCSFDTTHWRFGVYIPGKQTWLWDVPPPGQVQVRHGWNILISLSIWLFQRHTTCMGRPSHRTMSGWGSLTQEITHQNMAWKKFHGSIH